MWFNLLFAPGGSMRMCGFAPSSALPPLSLVEELRVVAQVQSRLQAVVKESVCSMVVQILARQARRFCEGATDRKRERGREL